MKNKNLSLACMALTLFSLSGCCCVDLGLDPLQPDQFQDATPPDAILAPSPNVVPPDQSAP